MRKNVLHLRIEDVSRIIFADYAVSLSRQTDEHLWRREEIFCEGCKYKFHSRQRIRDQMPTYSRVGCFFFLSRRNNLNSCLVSSPVILIMEFHKTWNYFVLPVLFIKQRSVAQKTRAVKMWKVFGAGWENGETTMKHRPVRAAFAK